MALHMTEKICRFCGIATDVPHQSQQVCIAALHGEIARMRQVLESVRPTGPLPYPREADPEPS